MSESVFGCDSHLQMQYSFEMSCPRAAGGRDAWNPMKPLCLRPFSNSCFYLFSCFWAVISMCFWMSLLRCATRCSVDSFGWNICDSHLFCWDCTQWYRQSFPAFCSVLPLHLPDIFIAPSISPILLVPNRHLLKSLFSTVSECRFLVLLHMPVLRAGILSIVHVHV